jgi:hypothetical protein
MRDTRIESQDVIPPILLTSDALGGFNRIFNRITDGPILLAINLARPAASCYSAAHSVFDPLVFTTRPFNFETATS